MEISRQSTPAAFDANGEIIPCALVRVEAETNIAPYIPGSRQFVVVYFYERTGYTTIDAAIDRVYELLNYQTLGECGVWEITHVDDSRDIEDDALKVSLSFSRYSVTWLRGPVP